MKKSAPLLLICTLLVACSSNHPGKSETGYKGLPWGTDAQQVANVLNVAPDVVSGHTLFKDYYQGDGSKVGLLLTKGFCKLMTGNGDLDVDGIQALKNVTMLKQGVHGYSLFTNHRFGMNLEVVPPSDYQKDHDRLMKRYGLIDKKREYRPGKYRLSYLIMWRNLDGVVILAKERDTKDPSHPLLATQIIHMDKGLFNLISGELAKQKS